MQCTDCPRGRDDCVPLHNVVSDEGESFVCVGYNQPKNREVEHDRFTMCWKTAVVDERGHWDKRDLLDTMSVISVALSVDENIRVGEELSDSDMDALDFVAMSLGGG